MTESAAPAPAATETPPNGATAHAEPAAAEIASASETALVAEAKSPNDVGGQVKVSPDEAELIKTSMQKVEDTQKRLGALRAAYLSDEAALATELAQARNEAQTMIATIGKKHGLEINKSDRGYQFSFENSTFTRVR